LDVSEDRALERWWWRSLPRAWLQPTSASLKRLLVEQPTLVPSALDHLSRGGLIWPVLLRLDPSQATTVLAAVAWAFGLSELPPSSPTTALPDTRREEDASSERVPRFGPATPAVGRHSALVVTPSVPAAPWKSWLAPAATPEWLSREHLCLAGV